MSDIGRRFRLDPGNRKLRVTNLPEKARKGDMLLTPGLAPGAVLEVSFSSATNSGWLEVVEASMPLLLNGRPVRGRVSLRDGDVVHLNAYHALRCRFSAGVLDEEYHAIRTLSVEGVTKEFLRSGRVLDNIDLAVKRGEMVCILGPSGIREKHAALHAGRPAAAHPGAASVTTTSFCTAPRILSGPTSPSFPGKIFWMRP